MLCVCWQCRISLFAFLETKNTKPTSTRGTEVVSGVAEEAGAPLAPTPLLSSRFSGQEINENGLNGVHKSAFEPVTSSQNKRRKLNAHPSSESDNNSMPTTGEPVVEDQGHQQQ